MSTRRLECCIRCRNKKQLLYKVHVKTNEKNILIIVWFTWILGDERAGIHKRIDNIETSVQALTVTVNKLVTYVGAPRSDSVSKHQYIQDCLHHQIVNPKWSCIYGPNGPYTNHTNNNRGWSTTLRENAIVKRLD